MIKVYVATLALDGLLIYLRYRDSHVKPEHKAVSAWVQVAEGVRVRAVG